MGKTFPVSPLWNVEPCWNVSSNQRQSACIVSVDLVNELETREVHFQSITDGVDTKTPAGRFFFHVMASLAQMERELILERTRAGLEAARCAGRIGGRKRRMTDGKVQAARKLLESGTPPHEVAQSLGVSIPTLYRWVPASSRT
jgi:DNA invertase Pin-like site-specific DNA recombinase